MMMVFYSDFYVFPGNLLHDDVLYVQMYENAVGGRSPTNRCYCSIFVKDETYLHEMILLPSPRSSSRSNCLFLQKEQQKISLPPPASVVTLFVVIRTNQTVLTFADKVVAPP